MTFFSRCETMQRCEPASRGQAARRTRVPGDVSSFRSAISGFAEDIGILFRYAAGLDYYDRDRHLQGR